MYKKIIINVVEVYEVFKILLTNTFVISPVPGELTATRN